MVCSCREFRLLKKTQMETWEWVDKRKSLLSPFSGGWVGWKLLSDLLKREIGMLIYIPLITTCLFPAMTLSHLFVDKTDSIL